MNTAGVDSVIVAHWQWSVAAEKAKQRIRRGRRATLGLGVAGTVLVTAAAQADGSAGRVLAALAAAALASAPIVAGFFTGPNHIRTWTQLRSVSEAVKAEIYTYLAGVGSYHGSPAERSRQLLERCEAIQQAADVLPPAVPAGDLSSPQRWPRAGDIASYVTHRVDDQIGYYESQAAVAERRTTQFQWAGLVASLAAAVLGALEAATGGAAVTAWAPAITMVGASVGSYAAASRYEDDARAYKQTARRLRFLRDRWRLPAPATVSAAERTRLDTAFVTECEDAIAVENQTWTARWNADVPTPPASPAEQPA
ncbi:MULTISPECIES: DUF4231 domain-containing protein [Protofrankia]|uniref:SMODS and SLOG-associating 2TM effector domain-containing protein n=1 Tax=Protofrankia coriariae TaxID=1562887 RepID=A0ABR5F0T4_9ACTN|nr:MULTISPECIES: DUF4231 domain-containing protein [Protofrankia]KLL10330.1 hypothetical protein FrCorBMG51_18960 [Protofrankia coriariae]ONH34526.1 hypothetical protein BL254_15900 [Protofrankia sp. BMG5.30]